ncbi:hypothetical protein CALCODRAFT_493434 [Calocera cornea HHB12733]|uniref:Uncharacterized protein n=1 Tax=Calocera cornea HHB12733 TaxID=1353952 RepID=A0A165HT26_9BASI|nr:hypothetical protein CALCODRAFT_493434 [Calocera cornea HHB12733]
MQLIYSILVVSALATSLVSAAPLPAPKASDVQLNVRDILDGPASQDAFAYRSLNDDDDLEERGFKNFVSKGKTLVKKIGKGLGKLQTGLQKVDKYAQIGMKVAQAGINIANSVHRRDKEGDIEYELVLRSVDEDEDNDVLVLRDLATDEEMELDERNFKSFIKKVGHSLSKAAHLVLRDEDGAEIVIDMRDVDLEERNAASLEDLD